MRLFLFCHFGHQNGTGDGGIQRLGHAIARSRYGNGMRDARQNFCPNAVRLAPYDKDALGLGLHLEQVFAFQQGTIHGLAFSLGLLEIVGKVG